MSGDVLVRLRDALATRYRVERQVGQGGMAIVFLARDLKYDRDVAIKVLEPDLAAATSAERFLREIRIGAGLQHPLILPLYESGQADGLLFYVMPFVAGESLRDRLRREKSLPVNEAVRIAVEVADALAYAHAQGVVHRDIKPDNIMLGGDHALVADFGVARAIDVADEGNLTATGVAVGTPAYMSPEQASGESGIDARSDIYALGCVVYEMLAGEPPFTGPSLQAVVARHLSQPPPPLRVIRPNAPEHVQIAVETALAKIPADRFQTARAFADALSTPSMTPVTPVTVAKAPRVSRAGRRRMAAAMAALLVIAGAWGAWRLWPRVPVLDHNLVAIAPFNVISDDQEVWSEGLVDVLSRALHGAGPLRVVSPSTTVRGWSGLADRVSAVALGRRTGAGIAIFGALRPLGPGSVRLSATALNVATDSTLGEEIQVDGSADRLGFLADSCAVQLLNAISRERSIAAVRQASVQGSSLPALRTYLRGEQFFRRTVWDSAEAAYVRAAEIDSTFALAIHRQYLVRLMKGSGQDSANWNLALTAGRMNRGLAPRESLLVVGDSLLAAIMLRQGLADSLLFSQTQRLLETVDRATRRFPDDPQVWFQFGLAQLRIGDSHTATNEEVLAALDRSIALDSLFAPPYVVALNLAMELKGDTAARRYMKSYMALRPTGLHAEATGLATRLMNLDDDDHAARKRLLDSASTLAIWRALQVLEFWFDPAETAVQMAGRLADGRDLSSISGFADFGRLTYGVMLAWRGHADSAAKVYGNLRLGRTLLWHLRAIPEDSVRARINQLFTTPREPVGRFMPWLASLHQLRDTMTLHRLLALASAKTPAEASSGERDHARYIADGANAYLALARADTMTAANHMRAMADSLCSLCFVDRLNRARVLIAVGDYAEAATQLDRDLTGVARPLDGLWHLERARVAERTGNRSGAIAAYSYITRVWARADSQLQPVVREARTALNRLGYRSR